MPYPNRNPFLPPSYRDALVPLDRAQIIGGPNDATFAEMSGGWNLYAWRFATGKYIHFTLQLNHDYKPGTNITPHVHWCPVDGNGGNVAWTLDYSLARGNTDAWASPTPISATPAAAGSTAFKHLITSFGEISLATNTTPSTILVCRLGRTATADTYGSNVFAVSFDFHYQIDRPGSGSVLAY